MTRNFKLVIEYDGTGFAGWQRQTSAPTIQAELEKVLSRILNQNIRIHGSGRTDAGVHALGQVAHFHARTAMPCQDLQKGVNSLIKHPIVVRDCSQAADDFHAQFHARSKEYNYHILNRREPCAIGAAFVWHVRQPLDLDRMNACCAHLTGSHDFKSFENVGSPRSSTVREVFSAGFEPLEAHRLVFKISATGFLKNMVRNLVGTLVDAGKGKIDPGTFQTILASRDRTLAGATAPAKGLVLKEVFYD